MILTVHFKSSVTSCCELYFLNRFDISLCQFSVFFPDVTTRQKYYTYKLNYSQSDGILLFVKI